MVQDYSNESKVSSTQLLYNHGGITYIGTMVVQKKKALLANLDFMSIARTDRAKYIILYVV